MRKLTCAVMGALMITSVLAGCGKKENTTTAGNEGNSRLARRRKAVLRVRKTVATIK